MKVKHFLSLDSTFNAHSPALVYFCICHVNCTNYFHQEINFPFVESKEFVDETQIENIFWKRLNDILSTLFRMSMVKAKKQSLLSGPRLYLMKLEKNWFCQHLRTMGYR